jgi:pyrroline-5-carboxylate reductase
MKIGFVGLGHLGMILIESMIDSGVLNNCSVFVHNRSLKKAYDLKDKYPDIVVMMDRKDFLNTTDVVISCIPAINQPELLNEFTNCTTHFICASNGIELADLKKVYSGPISRVMPSVLSKNNKGYTLMCHNEFVSNEMIVEINTLFEAISKVFEVTEEDMSIMTIVTSSGPGIYSNLIKIMLKTLSKETSIKSYVLKDILLETIYGTVELLQTNEDIDSFIGEVATKGGLTETCNKTLSAEFKTIYKEMIKQALVFNKNTLAENRKNTY